MGVRFDVATRQLSLYLACEGLRYRFVCGRNEPAGEWDAAGSAAGSQPSIPAAGGTAWRAASPPLPAFVSALDGGDMPEGTAVRVAVAGRRSASMPDRLAHSSGGGGGGGSAGPGISTSAMDASRSRASDGTASAKPMSNFASITDGLAALDDTLSLFVSGRMSSEAAGHSDE